MLNHYPLWKNLLLLLVLLVGVIYALPNLYGTDPALQVSASRNATLNNATLARVRNELEGDNIPFKSIVQDKTGLLVRFGSIEDQLLAQEKVSELLGEQYTVAMNISSAAPGWLQGTFHALPMYLGLDLRGGLHFLMEIDTVTVLNHSYQQVVDDSRSLLRGKKIHYLKLNRPGEDVVMKFRSADLRDRAVSVIKQDKPNLILDETEEQGAFFIHARYSEAGMKEVYKQVLTQTVMALRERVNEIGVAEPVIQRQGDSRIVVQLPGVQDSADAKKKLAGTDTVEFRMVDMEHSALDAKAGKVPPGARLYYDQDGRPVLLKKRIVISGERINGAVSGYDQDSASPMVTVTLDSTGAHIMGKNTQKNLQKKMAVVLIQNKLVSKTVNGKEVVQNKITEKVINVATIQGVFSKRFQITGMESPKEAQYLAFQLRNALPIPIRIVEERTIGPSLGKDNIKQGTLSVVVGMSLVVVFMMLWYRGFGLIANVALMANLVLIMAVLSLLQATLTLPGIAGIVLTVGMAVDANVLIFERIREELRNGNTPQSSINAGFDKALSTIADANITTLIAAVVLFVMGTGPIKGFAITLSIGILTSMFTAIMGTRAIINLAVSGRKIKTLSI